MALKIAQVGCGGMGLRHMYGEIELKRQGYDTFDVVALCDLNESAAAHVATVAEDGLGMRPRVYTDFDELLRTEKPDAVDVVTDSRFHHVAAVKAFEAGVHVAVEKPLGITVRACQAMIEAAEKAGCVLSVSENYRRDPMNRLVRAIIDAQAIGDPRLFVDMGLSGTKFMPHSTAWRHIKVRGGYLLDYAVHNADLMLYFMGDVESVYAETRLWERVRKVNREPLSKSMQRFYSHRVADPVEESDTIEADSEDMALGLVRFESGALGQFGMSIAAPGRGTGARVIYCDDGSIGLPGSRSGQPVRITPAGQQESIPEDDALALAPDWELDDLTASFWDGRRRMSSYEMDFPAIDAKIIALELQDVANAVLHGTELEVTGEVGLKAVALTYAFLESGALREPVAFDDVANDRVNGYQSEINAVAGL